MGKALFDDEISLDNIIDTRKEKISYSKEYLYSRKYSNRIYYIDYKYPPKKIKRHALKMEVREKPFQYEDKIIPFELVGFYCDDYATRYLTSFVNTNMLDIINYVKRYYNIECLCGILYCKNPKVVSVITQCYPMCKLEDCDIYIEDKYQKAQVDDIKEETLSQTTN